MPVLKRLAIGAALALVAGIGYGWFKGDGVAVAAVGPQASAAAASAAVPAPIASADVGAGAAVPTDAPSSKLPPAVQALFHAPDLYAVHLRYRDSGKPEELYAAWRAIDVCGRMAKGLRAGKSADALTRDPDGERPTYHEEPKLQQAMERLRAPHLARCRGFVELADAGRVRAELIRRAAALGSLPARLSLSRPPNPKRDPERFAAWQQDFRRLAAEALSGGDPLALWTLAEHNGGFVPALDYAVVRQQEKDRLALLDRLVPGMGAAFAPRQDADYRSERALVQQAFAAVLRERAVQGGYDLGPRSSAAMLYCERHSYVQCGDARGLRQRLDLGDRDLAIRRFKAAGHSDAAVAEVLRAVDQQARDEDARHAQLKRMLDEAIERGDFGPLGLGERLI
ncbi:hypothetical protein [Chitinimonas koreensis]|uniref:hypothetical protein n=1 Tax=Chitinimonas koreensis TaxID=356302 RepID=UPI0004232847|nr:hypothetical protein [Chitinimonas koreensis]QNM97560.1 hypothetical protein H9L41_04450 [Chitinimonas koreensis]